MAFRSLTLSLGILHSLTSAAPTAEQLDERQLLELFEDDYAPVKTSCPSTALVRPANGISPDESNYFNSRKAKADVGLAAWLKGRGNFSTDRLPSVGLASSGGGFRALLEGAGVVQALDGRDSNVGTSGLYQGLTYESGLSGGAWFLSSLAGNNWPTVSSLRDGLWLDAFENSFLVPANIMNSDQYAEIIKDLSAKDKAGFDNTIVDSYGRLLSYGLLYGPDGGDEIRLSTLLTYSNFTSHNVPYPIMTTLGVDRGYDAQCTPTINATQYEFHPYEYGSWDSGVSAFAQTKYMGSNLTNGRPTQSNKCIEHYDNIGYIFGTSSDVFSSLCAPLEPLLSSNTSLANLLQGFISLTKGPEFKDLFGLYPNPFYQYPRSSRVNTQPLLTMVDGGVAGQNVPIWPFIQPGRTVDVLITADNSADTDNYFPNGTELHQTYLNARAAGLTKMPYIPDADTFIARNLTKRAQFFGCDSSKNGTLLIVWLPNVDYVYPSNKSTLKIQYSRNETEGMLRNGNAIATQNEDREWPFCLACAIKHKDGLGRLPRGCGACFRKYCYRE